MLKRKPLLATLAAAALALASVASPYRASAQETAPAPAAEAPAAEAAATPAEPDVEQRLSDLEAYVNNSPRGANATDAKVGTKIPGPGPGHNAWQMVSAALVLFMTLPGLALFYGGLVRSKNVLSVLAMCLGLTGLVTILWFICGYSLCFAGGTAYTHE